MKYTFLLACSILSFNVWSQKLDLDLMADKRGVQDGFQFSDLEVPQSHWSVEVTLGLSNWSPFSLPNGEAIMSSSLETFYDLSVSEMSVTMDRLRFNTNVINHWNNRSYGSSGERVNTFRVRLRPFENKPISFSFGTGKAVGFFLAESQRIEGANSITTPVGLNQSQAISYAALDSYFHLQSIYGEWLPVDVELPEPWVSRFYEVGVGYSILPQFNLYVCYAPMLLSKNDLESWFDEILSKTHNPTLSPLENIAIADHAVIGGQLTAGHFMLGLERRWTYFTQSAASYYQLGARPLEEQLSWAINVGYHF